jgi:hypothetical protein
MATRSKTRSELKQYFVKNAIPTESNFADLIDGQLNQSDDGVFKQPDQPLAVVAAGGEQKRVLQLYSTYPAANPDWLLNLNPRPLGASSGTAAGFGIADGTGATRLMLDAAGNLAVTGKLGVGGDLQVNGARIRNSSGLGLLEANANDLLRINPDGAFPAIAVYKPMSLVTGGLVVGSLVTAEQGELVVTGSASIGNGLKVALPGGTAGGWNQFAVSLTNGWGDAGANFATIGAGGAAGIMFNNPHVAWFAGETRASIRYGRTGGKAGDTWWDAGVRTDGAFTWNAKDNGGIGEILRLSKTGEVAFANSLKVSLPGGSAGGWSLFTVTLTNGWDAGANFVTIGAGGAAGIMFNNPHVAWYAVENRASIRYGRTGGRPGETWWDAGVRADGAFTLNANENTGIGETLRVNRNGEFTIRFPQGRWVFQTDGNLVKYNNANQPLWAINLVNGRLGW